MMYYEDKLSVIKEIFSADKIELKRSFIKIDGVQYPIIEDVIIVSDPVSRTAYVKKTTGASEPGRNNDAVFSEPVQFSFGSEWSEYNEILPEHKNEFERYFDIVDLEDLKDKRVADLGCGNGRWSSFISDKCRELVLVDFSDAIFIARKNLASKKNCIFIMADLRKLPFKADCFDFAFSLGVLHHLPVPCLQAVKDLSLYSPELLVFLYYSLDNRPFYFRLILWFVTMARLILSSIRSSLFRKSFSLFCTYTLYLPLINLGKLLDIFSLGKYVPLYDFYKDKTLHRIEQDVYDRFFTSIEQRVSKKEIKSLEDYFGSVIISEELPYWHFLCIK